MSTDDVATVHKAYAAFNGNNIPALLNLLAPDVTWCNPAELPYGGSYQGPVGVLEALRKLAHTFDSYCLQVDYFAAAGEDRVLVLGLISARLRSETARAEFAHVWTTRDGKITGFRNFTDCASLLELLGNPESAPLEVDANARIPGNRTSATSRAG